jgi:hypothetical protein
MLRTALVSRVASQRRVDRALHSETHLGKNNAKKSSQIYTCRSFSMAPERFSNNFVPSKIASRHAGRSQRHYTTFIGVRHQIILSHHYSNSKILSLIYFLSIEPNSFFFIFVQDEDNGLRLLKIESNAEREHYASILTQGKSPHAAEASTFHSILTFLPREEGKLLPKEAILGWLKQYGISS